MEHTELELKVINYFEDEYSRLARIINDPPSWLSRNEAVQNCLQRCLGVAEFAQELGVEFSLLENLMDGQRNRCYDL